MGVRELVELVFALDARARSLEREVARLQRRPPLCGNMGTGQSCQREAGHDGLHAWQTPDGELEIRWG